ncbi:2Fe-2S iron-sulfur cluster-binding protein [Streptomyces sp. UNOC14_S4]|uniref:2Fe-2S iron-sulfur cluster-binding protein n=1 Tax=Streptomyces sp. UNOC14_S4 TaxID=2872340 RepID=UPI001E386A61|nr:2Fe-2S iron-sulfur cluster-binding protein [Streptomyces sp. UNOC14_S4]MCC3767319.1 (2Fe-2S)-binding protein [Streptomyces sp. UNOC14_S4]
MSNLRFVNAEESLEFDESVPLKDMVDYVTFGCRSGKCGMCMVRVEEGAHNMSPRTEKEERLFALLEISDPAMRLACQSRAHGDVVLYEVN